MYNKNMNDNKTEVKKMTENQRRAIEGIVKDLTKAKLENDKWSKTFKKLKKDVEPLIDKKETFIFEDLGTETILSKANRPNVKYDMDEFWKQVEKKFDKKTFNSLKKMYESVKTESKTEYLKVNLKHIDLQEEG